MLIEIQEKKMGIEIFGENPIDFLTIKKHFNSVQTSAKMYESMPPKQSHRRNRSEAYSSYSENNRGDASSQKFKQRNRKRTFEKMEGSYKEEGEKGQDGGKDPKARCKKRRKDKSGLFRGLNA